MSERCGRCKAPIRYARDELGQVRVLDAEPDPAGSVSLERIAGQRVAVTLPPASLERLREQGDPRPLYMPHVATCPFTDRPRPRPPRGWAS